MDAVEAAFFRPLVDENAQRSVPVRDGALQLIISPEASSPLCVDRLHISVDKVSVSRVVSLTRTAQRNTSTMAPSSSWRQKLPDLLLFSHPQFPLNSRKWSEEPWGVCVNESACVCDGNKELIIYTLERSLGRRASHGSWNVHREGARRRRIRGGDDGVTHGDRPN